MLEIEKDNNRILIQDFSKKIKKHKNDRIIYANIKEKKCIKIPKNNKKSIKASKSEIIFYNSINDLSEKIKFYKKNEKSRVKIAKNGKKKYFKLFNELKITKYIIDKSLGNKSTLY